MAFNNKKKNANYISAKESRAIARENRKITQEIEKKRNRDGDSIVVLWSYDQGDRTTRIQTTHKTKIKETESIFRRRNM